ncbi:MAG: CRTAC1 family protein, partial [Actinomycetota bacterium]
AGLAVQGDGCAAGDLDGDGRTDLVVTTTTGVDALWNTGHGRFTQRRFPGPSGWYTGTAISDVDGDGRPEVFAAGYADPNRPVPTSIAGFPTNLTGVRDLLFRNEGRRAFREIGAQAGLEVASFRHGLGAQFMTAQDGPSELYVANDEDSNQLYVDVPWPGGRAADPAGLGFRFEERATLAGVADPFAGMGIATSEGRLLVTNSRGEPSAAYRRHGTRFVDARPEVAPALGTNFAGWGASWVDLRNTGRADLVLAAGAIPVTNLARDAERVRVLAPTTGGAFADATSVLGKRTLRVNGRGVASADAHNDGRMQIAINTIGGKLVLLRPSGKLGHWLDVELTRFSPGAVVTAVLPNGKRLSREVTVGSSYLSSEDPRVHFGLGRVTRVARLIVRFRSGTTTQVDRIAADRVVSVTAPVVRHTAPPAPSAALLTNCTPATHGRSVARIWNDSAIAALRVGNASEPVQARDLYQLSAAVARAYALATTSARRDAAISYAAYRLLVWQASFNANLAQSFTLLTRQLRALCFTQDFTSVSGPAAGLGNRVGAHAVDAGRSDGSNESLHFADPTFTPQNQPLIVAEAGSAVHDATFWQPLALARVRPRGSPTVPAQVQDFVGSQWGSVRPFAGTVPVSAPGLGDPSGAAYRNAALAAIRATAEPSPAASVDPSPVGWNASLASLGLRRDVELDLALNGALNDAAVSVFAAKRRYNAPRPISMIRYLAFTGGLPTAAGLTRRADGVVQVRREGRWVRGDRWTPPVPTPPSPGYPSADAAFAYAAATVLGGSAAARAADAAGIGIRNATELPLDVAAGRKAGIAAGKLARARAGW